MSSKTEIEALEIMSGAHGSALLTGTSLYTPPLGLAIQAFVATEDTVIASASVYKNGFVRSASEYTGATIAADAQMMTPASQPIASITLTSGAGVVYFCKIEGFQKTSYTATAAGLTTGAILPTAKGIFISSPTADSVCCLPTTGASTVGLEFYGIVYANGFELRPIAAQAATVYINGVTTSVEAAIPAQSTFTIRCIDATHWILRVWDFTGAERAAIVPDAI